VSKYIFGKNIYFLLVFAFLFFFLAGNSIFSFSQEISSDIYNQLKYRHIGPQGNRVISVAGVLGDPNVYYAGAASGGIWKSTDGGIHWNPIFDDQDVSSIGALAVAHSDKNVIWAGTGETFIRSNISIGNGIYRSTDGGKNWSHMGLDKTGRIGRIVIDPHDPNIVFAAAMGHCYGPQPERGVFRTKDSGKNWKKVLFVDNKTGCSDIAMDPNNPRILFAGMWQLEIKTWGRWSGGPGSGLFMSRDGGDTWKRLKGHGLPPSPVGKISVATAPSNSDRIYALIETGDGEPRMESKSKGGVLWRSDDGGESWNLVNSSHTLTQRPHYYSRCAVAPDDHDELYFLAPRASISVDGGLSYKRFSVAGGDHHDMWIDPENPGRMIIGNDQYVSISVNRGKSWHGTRLPIAQMYHVAVDNQIPYFVLGNRQDGPSTRGPSNSLTGRSIPSGMWSHIGACECGFSVPDPVENNIIWSGCFAAGFTRFDLKTGHARSVEIWPESYMGWPAGDVKYRIQWTFPITISPHDHNKVYTGSQYVHQTTNGGQSWTVISPDLSTNDKSKQEDSGGLTIDNLGVEYGCLVFAIAESPVEEGVIWAGTNDGLLHVTRDGGKNWSNITDNIPSLPPWGTVSNIEPSRYDAGTCYFTMDFHQVNNRDPYVYKTTDYGKSWKSISSNIPKSVFSYAHCVREDPVRKGLLYLGTENALYVSFTDGDYWVSLQTNLPHAPVHWLTIQEHFNDLVVATYGRGFWILDDITPLQQLNPDVLESDIHLFSPRPTYRFLQVGAPMTQQADMSEGDNPPYGASINYYLKTRPEDKVKIDILDDEDQIIKTLKGKKEQGLNRIWWDLRYAESKQSKLRTSPLDASYVKLGPQGWRPISTWGVRQEGIRPLVVPGTYTVKLSVGSRELRQKLIVKKDPNSAGTLEDIQAQVKLSLEIKAELDSVVDNINAIEWIRKQIYDLDQILKEDENSKEVIEAGKKLDKKLISLEKNLFQMRLSGAGQDVFRNPSKLYARLGFLYQKVESSWGGLGNDFRPTDQQIEVFELLQKRHAALQKQIDNILGTDLANFNDLLRSKNQKNILVVK